MAEETNNLEEYTNQKRYETLEKNGGRVFVRASPNYPEILPQVRDELNAYIAPDSVSETELTYTFPPGAESLKDLVSYENQGYVNIRMIPNTGPRQAKKSAEQEQQEIEAAREEAKQHAIAMAQRFRPDVVSAIQNAPVERPIVIESPPQLQSIPSGQPIIETPALEEGYPFTKPEEPVKQAIAEVTQAVVKLNQKEEEDEKKREREDNARHVLEHENRLIKLREEYKARQEAKAQEEAQKKAIAVPIAISVKKKAKQDETMVTESQINQLEKAREALKEAKMNKQLQDLKNQIASINKPEKKAAKKEKRKKQVKYLKKRIRRARKVQAQRPRYSNPGGLAPVVNLPELINQARQALKEREARRIQNQIAQIERLKARKIGNELQEDIHERSVESARPTAFYQIKDFLTRRKEVQARRRALEVERLKREIAARNRIQDSRLEELKLRRQLEA